MLVPHLYASKINFSDLCATDTELPSAPSSVQLDEGSTSHVLSLYKGKKEQGTVFIEVNRFQLSRLRQIMKIYKDPHFQLTKSPDVNFYNEQCADLGGPTKEFFHDAIACLVKVDFLEACRVISFHFMGSMLWLSVVLKLLERL